MTYELGSIGEGKSAAEIKNIIKSRQQAYSEVRDYLIGNNRQATQLFNERKQKDRANQIYRNTRLSRYVDTITESSHRRAISDTHSRETYLSMQRKSTGMLYSILGDD